MSIPPVIEEAPHAFNTDRVEGSSAFEVAPVALAYLSPLGILAPDQPGPAGSSENPHAWQQAYQQASTTAEKSRLFEQARQTYQDQRDYTALLRLAQEHLQQVHTPQERAGCLLVAGEALIQLQQYQEARLHYLEPALALVGTAPETRLHLWHYLGLSYLAEHAFPAAAAAFRQSADLALGQHFASGTASLAAQRTQLHHLRNAAHFYDGIIHLIYQRPQQTIQAFQELHRPLTSLGTLNIALYMGLAYRMLQQPEAATRALQVLHRATSPEPMRGPAAVVRAGIANLGEGLSAVGEHLEMALDVAMPPAMSWELSWRAGLYYELGLALQRAGSRASAMVCYEESLKIIAQRAGLAPEQCPDTLEGPALLTMLAALPVENWSAVVRGEMLHVLQGLAWLYGRIQQLEHADAALQLALRLACTPEQQAAVWFQRAWCVATSMPLEATTAPLVVAVHTDLVSALDTLRTSLPNAIVTQILHGVTALLRGEVAQALEGFTHVPDVPEMPEFQALCVAAWLWAHTQCGTLAQVLKEAAALPVPPWHVSTTLVAALEALLAWTIQRHGDNAAATAAWLAPLLTQQEAQVLPVLHVLCRRGYLLEPERVVLVAALTHICNMPEYAGLTDQIAVLLGNAALRANIEALLYQLDQRLTEPPEPTRGGGVRLGRKQRPQRQAPVPVANLPETARLQQVIGLIHSANAAATDMDLPQEICRWLLRYPRLSSQAPEVVGAILGLLRQCPGAAAVIPTLLEQVPLSRRQRQALEGVLQTPVPPPSPGGDLSLWEVLQHDTLGRLLEALAGTPGALVSGTAQPGTALHWYTAALILARVGLSAKAATYLSTCLQLQPQQPFVHYQHARLLRQQQQYDQALHHMLASWHGLQETPGPVQVWHLEILNQLLSLLQETQQYERFAEWLTQFAQQRARLSAEALGSREQQRLQEQEGEFALFRAQYLARVTPNRLEMFAQQLPFLAQAVAQGTPTVRAQALPLQAQALAGLHRYDAAVASYAALLQENPEDQHVQARLAFYTALQHLAQSKTAPDRVVTDVLGLIFPSAESSGLVSPPQTPQEALAWLQQAAPEDPRYADVVSVLTTYAEGAAQRHDFSSVIALLTPLYAVAAQPRQAYYLAEAYYARSKQTTSVTDQLYNNEQALQYAHSARADKTLGVLVTALLHQLQEHHQTLMTAKQREEIFTTYRDRMRGLFTYYRVPFVEEEPTQLPPTVWLELDDIADVDETSGELVTTVKLRFNHYAVGSEPEPSEPEIALYAQHQRDKQRIIKAHGMEALVWPHTTYLGATPFTVVFPERLGLNRDLLFIAFADFSVLLRYARVLQYTYRTLLSPSPGQKPPTPAALAMAARYCTIIPFLLQRLRTLANASSVKALQRQIVPFREALAVSSRLGFFQGFQVFTDAYTYFREIADTLRPHLDTPPAERENVQHEERQLRRPQLRQQRRQRHLREYVDEEEEEVDC